jgi:hypothetical protein
MVGNKIEATRLGWLGRQPAMPGRPEAHLEGKAADGYLLGPAASRLGDVDKSADAIVRLAVELAEI